MTPFLKWPGGKRALVPTLLWYFPASCRRYFEPFLGGGAVFFAMAGRFESAELSDASTPLITCWRGVRDDVDAVIRDLAGMPVSAEHYAGVASTIGDGSSATAAEVVYLNRLSFNGLWRFNAAGRFNAPFNGRKAKSGADLIDHGVLRAASAAIATVDLQCRQFDAIDPRRGDVVYFDPPYLDDLSTAFTGYTADGFEIADHVRLRDFAEHLVDRGVHVVLSNADNSRVRALYERRGLFEIHEATAPRSISCKSSSRTDARELIIVGKRG